MNFIERKTLIYRFVAFTLLLISLGVTSFSLSQIIVLRPEELILMLITIAICALFAILESIFILKGWKKESNLQKIAFNENSHVNNVPLIGVSVGTAFGLGLLALGISVYLIRVEPTVKASMLAVLSVSVYLLVNCLIYYIYLIMFKNRPLNLKDLIK
jgi:hypothetical protein